MDLAEVGVSARAAVQPTIKDPSAGGRYGGMMLCFLLSYFCNWTCEPGSEQRQSGQSARSTQTRRNQHTKECGSNKGITLSRRGLSEKRGHKTACLETDTGTKDWGLGYNISTQGACHSGYDFRPKHCESTGGSNLREADTRAETTGLNLHLILVILFSTNKLTPEKT